MNYFILVVRDIKTGDFLLMYYNKTDSVQYFENEDTLSMWSIVSANTPLQTRMVRGFIRKFSSRFPGYVQENI